MYRNLSILFFIARTRVVIFAYLMASLLCCSAAASLAEPEVEFVGRQVCAECHQQQDKLWQGSHHDWAMREANSDSVLGNFNDVEFIHFGEKTRFFQRDGEYWVLTSNAEGKPQEFKVDYTFGFYPLQQYLLSTSDGRLQALNVSWDSRPATNGGQRWFHLYPDEAIPFDDVLHWTGPYQNWNSRCAECHSTNLERNYDVQKNRYDTSWSEINVSCEACHGPGAKHVSLMRGADGAIKASAKLGFDRQLNPVGQWLRDKDSPTATNPQALAADHDQLSVCGSCHSRRALIADQDLAGDYHQKHNLQLVQSPLYHTDGQILDEVYVLGSFMQSKMHQKGVVCSNCHEPHSLSLRAPGNGVCAQCHSPEVFDQPSHHHHKASSTGAQCVNCHMPETTYMVVDPRRDHSLRVPRPDLSVAYGTPNACNQCHQDRQPQWASDAVDGWLKAAGRTRQKHFSDDLVPALSGAEDAQQRLMKIAMSRHQPSIIQASALAALGSHVNSQTVLVAQTQLANTSAMVRAAAVDVLALLPIDQRWQDLAALMDDPSKQVRMAVARHTAEVDTSGLSPAVREQWLALQQDYLAVLALHQDTADGQMNIGLQKLRQGDPVGAQEAYRTALKWNPSHVGGYLNLSDLYRQLGDEDQAAAVLQQGLERLPEVAALHHSLGLMLVRRKQYGAAQAALARAAMLEPTNIRYGYLNGLILQRQRQFDMAVAQWQRVLVLAPMDRDILMALLGQLQRSSQRNGPQALEYAERLLVLMPDDQQLAQLVAQMREGAEP